MSDTRTLVLSALTTRAEDITQLAKLGNGFEGWIKFCVAQSFLAAGRAPWNHLLDEAEADQGDVHVEWRRPLLRRAGRATKLVDLGVRSAARERLFDYFEFKVVFAAVNSGKQARSWASDLWFLQRLSPAASARSVASIAVAVGFDEAGWGILRERAVRAMFGESHPQLRKPTPLGPGSSSIFIDLLG